MTVADTGVGSPLDAARTLAPTIRQHAEEIERERELPRPLFEALADAGLFHLLIPRTLGGRELDLPTYIRVVEEIAKADASTAWCLNQGAVFATHAACVPEALGRLIWIDTPRSVVANTPMPDATAVPVPGGYRVTGRQGFSTGCRHASWIAARARVFENGQVRRRADGVVDVRFCMFPVSEVELLDTWQVRGMRGTGTHHFQVSDAFVPEERTFPHDAPILPGHGPLYLVPRTQLFACGDAAAALGLARSSIETFITLAGGKTPTKSGGLLRDRPVVQSEIGHVEATVRAARALLTQTVDDLWAQLCATGTISLEQRVGLRVAVTHPIRLAAQVVDTLYNLAGATAIYESHPLQRQFQDVHVITQHIQARLDHYETVGRFYLGLEPDGQHL